MPPPCKADERISTIVANPYPLWPPRFRPRLPEEAGGFPVLEPLQDLPGIQGSAAVRINGPPWFALRAFPMEHLIGPALNDGGGGIEQEGARFVVAGGAEGNGFVPSIGRVAKVGAIDGRAFVQVSPTIPAFTAIKG